MPTKYGVVNEEERSNDEQELAQRLLRFGGERVVLMQDSPEFVQKLIASGITFPGKGAKRLAGTQSRCHVNAMIHYIQFLNYQTRHRRCEIVSGYALAGGIWVQHSWLMIDGKVGETTNKRDLYFGLVLSAEDEFKFVMQEVVSLLPGNAIWSKKVAA